MARKKPEIKQQIQNPEGYPAGTIIEEFWDGTVIKTNPDGTKEVTGKDGKVISGVVIKDEQIEAWRKMPKEEATKKILELINNNGHDVGEKRFVLDAIWKLAELHGATQPQYQSQNIVAIQIHVADLPPGIKVMNAQSPIIESEDKR